MGFVCRGWKTRAIDEVRPRNERKGKSLELGRPREENGGRKNNFKFVLRIENWNSFEFTTFFSKKLNSPLKHDI